MQAKNHRATVLAATGVTLGDADNQPKEMIHCPEAAGDDPHKRPNMLKSSCETRQRDHRLPTCFGGCNAGQKQKKVETERPPIQVKATCFLALAVADRTIDELVELARCEYDTARVYRAEWRRMNTNKKVNAIRSAMKHFLTELTSIEDGRRDKDGID